ncbi:hypothetical protein ACJX0J_042452, partial [Zea mays]
SHGLGYYLFSFAFEYSINYKWGFWNYGTLAYYLAVRSNRKFVAHSSQMKSANLLYSGFSFIHDFSLYHLLLHTIIESLIRYLELENNCLIYHFHMHFMRHILATDQMTSDIWGLIDSEMVIMFMLKEVLLGFFILILSCIYVSQEWKILASSKLGDLHVLILFPIRSLKRPYIKRVQDRHKEVQFKEWPYEKTSSGDYSFHMCGLFLFQSLLFLSLHLKIVLNFVGILDKQHMMPIKRQDNPNNYKILLKNIDNHYIIVNSVCLHL